MKYFISTVLFCFAVSSVNGDVLRLSEPVQVDEKSETFGAPIETMPEIIPLSEILHSPDQYIKTSFATEATVKKVCQKKGCFFIAKHGQTSVRVAFKDYGFFVPTNITNRKVTLIGELTQPDISPEQAKHFSKDLGEKGSVKSGLNYQIIATSVRVPLDIKTSSVTTH